MLIGIFLLIAELMTMTFVLLSFAISCFIVAAIQYYLGFADFNRDIFIVIISSLFFVIFFRGLFRRNEDVKSVGADEDINQY